jgi:hypothetical protein
MVVIGAALQKRLLDAAREHLGAESEGVLRDAAERELDVPLEQVHYGQLATLIAAAERAAAPIAGRETAFAMASDFEALAADADAGLAGRLIGAVGKRLGPSAEPFLSNICGRVGLTLEEIERDQLPRLATGVRAEAALLLGADTAELVAQAVQEAGDARPPGLVQQVIAIARDHAGAEGEALVRDLCHQRLELELDEIPIAGIRPLARAVERDGPPRLGRSRTAAFLAAVQRAVISPATALREKIVALTSRQMGPAGPLFLKKATAKQGLPFDAVDYEHLMWLAEVIRAESAPIVGKQVADDLARDVRNLLTKPQ